MSDAPPDLQVEHNANCLACGSANESSLGFEIVRVQEDRLVARVRFGDTHEGGVGRVHGGAIGTALDEGLGRLAHVVFDGQDCMTAELTVRYLAPGWTGDECEVDARLERRDGRKLWLAGDLRRGDAVLASAEGLWLRARTDAPGPPV